MNKPGKISASLLRRTPMHGHIRAMIVFVRDSSRCIALMPPTKELPAGSRRASRRFLYAWRHTDTSFQKGIKWIQRNNLARRWTHFCLLDLPLSTTNHFKPGTVHKEILVGAMSILYSLCSTVSSDFAR